VLRRGIPALRADHLRAGRRRRVRTRELRDHDPAPRALCRAGRQREQTVRALHRSEYRAHRAGSAGRAGRRASMSGGYVQAARSYECRARTVPPPVPHHHDPSARRRHGSVATQFPCVAAPRGRYAEFHAK
jgi:hypothetical protein